MEPEGGKESTDSSHSLVTKGGIQALHTLSQPCGAAAVQKTGNPFGADALLSCTATGKSFQVEPQGMEGTPGSNAQSMTGLWVCKCAHLANSPTGTVAVWKVQHHNEGSALH